MGYSISILNNIRANASNEYQARIPEATQTNISTIGNALQTYTLLYNEFASALVNKIGKTIIERKLFQNKLAKFKQGKIATQQDVEEIFIEMAKSIGDFSSRGDTASTAGEALMRYPTPDVKVIYHRMNRQDVYAVTIGDIDFVRVFRSESTLDEFISGLINSVYSGANYDEWLCMKNLLATYDGYFDYDVPVIANATAEDGAKRFVKSLRKAVQDVSFVSTEYNKAHVKTWNDASDLVLFVNKDVLAEIDVEVLAKAFNMGKTDIQVDIISMDDFGALSDTYGLLIDRSAIRVFDTLSHMEPIRNPNLLTTNYFYHVHQILSMSTFKNTIRFKAVTEA